MHVAFVLSFNSSRLCIVRHICNVWFSKFLGKFSFLKLDQAAWAAYYQQYYAAQAAAGMQINNYLGMCVYTLYL